MQVREDFGWGAAIEYVKIPAQDPPYDGFTHEFLTAAILY